MHFSTSLFCSHLFLLFSTVFSEAFSCNEFEKKREFYRKRDENDQSRKWSIGIYARFPRHCAVYREKYLHYARECIKSSTFYISHFYLCECNVFLLQSFTKLYKLITFNVKCILFGLRIWNFRALCKRDRYRKPGLLWPSFELQKLFSNYYYV